MLTSVKVRHLLLHVKQSMKRAIYIFLTLPSICFGSNFDACFQAAGQRYGIDAGLLRAVAQTESSMRAHIESPTSDIGLMGINRSWLPILRKRFNLTEADVWNPCTNVMIGAWILASNFSQKGKNWNSVGMYNAACTKLQGASCLRTRQIYSQKVWTNWKKNQY